MGRVCSVTNLKLMEAYVLLAFLCILGNLGTSIDILRPGDIITPNSALVSSTGNFALGFFRPGNSSSSFLGIWYNNHNLKDGVIWVANRESPLHQDSDARFTLGDDGNLLLLDGARNAIWSTNVSGSGLAGNYTEAKLLDNGNLILKQGNNTVWGSFDDASDTLMPEMRLKVNMKTGKRNILRSWSSSDDPRPGKFSYGLDPNGAPQLFIWKQNVPYYRSTVFQYGYNSPSYFEKLGYSAISTFAVQGGDNYYNFWYPDASRPFRFILTPDGYVQFLYKPKGSNEWQNKWQFPDPSQCEMYGSCGSFGSCEKIGSHSACSCLEGFKPKSQKDWDNGNYSGGCERIIALGCNEDDKFKRFEWMKWPDHPTSLGNMTFTECQARCYRNCSCSAYAYANISNDFLANCLNWFGDLVDLAYKNPAAMNGDGHDLYVRVHASELYGDGEIQSSAHKNNTTAVHVAVIVSSVSAVFLIFGVLACIFKRTKGEKSKEMKSSKSNAPLVGNGNIELIQLSLERILDATDNFNEANKLGEGGFGPVYKGFLSEFGMVAIKRLCKRSSQGLEEFMNELKLIAKLQHKNLVSLLGCCTEEDEKILIYEYLPKRSLDKSLFDVEKDTLDWTTRFHIIEGVAQGILYLHKYSRLKVIHRDLKASNILLDETMKPKISDFGMARIFGLDQTQAETNNVVGTYGYISPEYVLHGQFSEKSDVFSFGVLLLEIVNGQKNSDFVHSQLSVSLIGWAWKNWKEGHTFEFVDPAIRESCDSLEVIRCIEVGLLCVQPIPTDRPTMSNVVLMLSNPTIAIPPLKEPAFVSSSCSNAIIVSTESCDYYSKNEVTISVIQPR